MLIYGVHLFLTLCSHDWPCRNFHIHGECEDGENCKFSHEELTYETRPLLDPVNSKCLLLYSVKCSINFCCFPVVFQSV